MAANTNVQMEATVGISFTFGSFPEVTVPRNPASGFPTAGGGVFAGVRSDLTPQASATSRILESENFDVATTPTRVTRRPAESADDLIFQIDHVGRSIAECIQLGELALRHQDDPDRVLHGLRNTSTGARSDLTAPSFITSRVSEHEAANVMTAFPKVTCHPAGSADDLLSHIDLVGRSIAESIQLNEYVLRHSNDPDRVLYGLRNAAATYSDQVQVLLPVTP